MSEPGVDALPVESVPAATHKGQGVGRVGHDRVDARFWHRLQDLDAVAEVDVPVHACLLAASSAETSARSASVGAGGDQPAGGVLAGGRDGALSALRTT